MFSQFLNLKCRNDSTQKARSENEKETREHKRENQWHYFGYGHNTDRYRFAAIEQTQFTIRAHKLRKMYLKNDSYY